MRVWCVAPRLSPAQSESHPIWLLPSTARPALCQDALDACATAGMSAPAYLYVDGDPNGAYSGIRLPTNWNMISFPDRRGLGAAMGWLYARWPDEPFYGWLADDLRPRTWGFDRLLEEAAGAWGFSCSADGWYSQDPRMVELVSKGHDMCGALCWGGELVKAAGCWAPLHHVGIDTAWCLVNSRLGNVHYCADVMVEHLQYKNGKRPKDATDEITVGETKYYQDGVLALREFNAGGNEGGPMMQMVARIKAKMQASLGESNPLDNPWWTEKM